MNKQVYPRDEVFGIQRDVPLNYVIRKHVDEMLIGSLSQGKHIVIHGSSKQGKTSLRKHCLADSDYIVIQCSNRWTLADLHASILKHAGYKITMTEKEAVSGARKVKASFVAQILGIGTSLEGEKENSKVSESEMRELELDPGDVNDVIRALESIHFKQFIVLEDFHYLPPETQRDFSVALKAFHESSNYTFIIVGVWLEENRLIVFNGDLTGRVISVNADVWSKDELLSVIKEGEDLLNIVFEEGFVHDLVNNAHDSVYIVQEACRVICEQEAIAATCKTPTRIGQGVNVEDLITQVVNQQSARYRSFIINFAEGFQKTRLEMHRWILHPILSAPLDMLRAGLKLPHIREALAQCHPEGPGLNYGNVTQALQSAASLQVKKEIKPIIVDYDETNLRMNVVDRGFLIWLSHQNRSELLSMAGLS